jgi:hypothetical protein
MFLRLILETKAVNITPYPILAFEQRKIGLKSKYYEHKYTND